MNRKMLLAASVLAAALPVAANAATVRLEKLAARVVVIPENRANITAEVRAGKGDVAKPVLRTVGADMIVTGDLTEEQLRSCSKSGDDPMKGVMKLSKRKNVRVEDLPVVTVRVPMDVTVVADGAVVGEVGASRSLNLTQRRCGAWRIGDVSGRLKLELEGFGDFHGGSAGEAAIDLEGMGDVTLRSTRSLTASLEGMGDLTLDQISGPVDVSLQGMGDVRIKGGRATTFKARLEGMGDVRFDGVVDTLDASADGMGSVRVAEARTVVRKSQSGFAKVKIGR